MKAEGRQGLTDYQDGPIRIDSNDTEGLVAWSEAYFALANIERANAKLLPGLQDYGMELDPAIAEQIKRDVARLRSEVDAYEKAIRSLETIAR